MPKVNKSIFSDGRHNIILKETEGCVVIGLHTLGCYMVSSVKIMFVYITFLYRGEKLIHCNLFSLSYGKCGDVLSKSRYYRQHQSLIVDKLTLSNFPLLFKSPHMEVLL